MRVLMPQEEHVAEERALGTDTEGSVLDKGGDTAFLTFGSKEIK